MSLMEFLDIRDGSLAPVYKRMLVPIRCDWCEIGFESLLALGTLWVCPAGIGKAQQAWGGMQIDPQGNSVQTFQISRKTNFEPDSCEDRNPEDSDWY
ncbi:MAG: hypothetical protein C75L2_00020096 [Leptospirillum sp. Group II 'C75']|jgi:hypothetical protein|uniref:hypothetical protein n=1 Tax=Leptospirillum sp. Group II 'CF-1' TaxID=1660083 RepID=UPI00029CD09E|nr:hypothetical protein [Leptospirillum sp. Group II 'CF-1']AKS22819.1 hypothetical protein ABH19_02230 [Leptospirillum sp. Group II 'CF-1']EIJ75198.1 MAG: hypothetical protein C75L2_00020096 [Leptospirillum sp. Group II 'C75']